MQLIKQMVEHFSQILRGLKGAYKNLHIIPGHVSQKLYADFLYVFGFGGSSLHMKMDIYFWETCPRIICRFLDADSKKRKYTKALGIYVFLCVLSIFSFGKFACNTSAYNFWETCPGIIWGWAFYSNLSVH